MLSRVAENLYWMARYVERAENVARLINVNANLLMDLPRGIAPGWEPLVAITGLREDFDERFSDYGERQVLRFLMADTNNGASIQSSLKAARENCRTVRDILPREIWELLNEMSLFAVEELQSGLTKKGRHRYLKRIIEGSQLFSGMLSGTMNRGAGFQFLRIGRNLERADMTTRIIDVRSADLLEEETSGLRPFDTIQWVSVLSSLSGYQMYRQHMRVQVRRSDVLKFLFQNNEFPRAVMHSLDAVEEGLGSLQKADSYTLSPLRDLVHKVERTRVERLDQEALHSFIDELQLGIIKVHDHIAEAYFLPAEAEAVGY